MTWRVPANCHTAVIWTTATVTTTIMTQGLELIICDNNGSKRGEGEEDKQKWSERESGRFVDMIWMLPIKTNINPS